MQIINFCSHLFSHFSIVSGSWSCCCWCIAGFLLAVQNVCRLLTRGFLIGFAVVAFECWWLAASCRSLLSDIPFLWFLAVLWVLSPSLFDVGVIVDYCRTLSHLVVSSEGLAGSWFVAGSVYFSCLFLGPRGRMGGYCLSQLVDRFMSVVRFRIVTYYLAFVALVLFEFDSSQFSLDGT